MELHFLDKDYTKGLKPAEKISPDTNTNSFEQYQIEDIESEENSKSDKKKSGSNNSNDSNIRDRLFELTSHPAFPRLLALFYQDDEDKLSEIKRIIRDKRGLDELLPFPKYTFSFVYYQNRRLQTYLNSLYHFANIPGKRFQGFI